MLRLLRLLRLHQVILGASGGVLFLLCVRACHVTLCLHYTTSLPLVDWFSGEFHLLECLFRDVMVRQSLNGGISLPFCLLEFMAVPCSTNTALSHHPPPNSSNPTHTNTPHTSPRRFVGRGVGF